MVGYRTFSPSEDAFGLHGDDFDGKMASRSEGTCLDLFGHVVWLVIEGIIHGVGACSLICESCLFEIKAMMFL